MRGTGSRAWPAPRSWWAVVALAAALWVAYLVVPARYEVLRSLVLYPLADLTALASILVGVRRHRPRAPRAWLLIAAGVAAFTVADVVYGAHEVAGTPPFPSAADVFYLAAYPLFAIGLHVASRARLPEGDRGTFIDAAIITVTAGLFACLLIAKQYVDDSDLSLLPAIVASAYPLADVLLLAVAVRFLLAMDWRTPALQLLAAGLALILSGDVLYSLGESFTVPGDTTRADALLLAGVLVLGLAGLHPSMTALTREHAEYAPPQYSARRVISLYLVSMVPVAVLAIQALLLDVKHVWITVTALVLVTTLVLLRFIDMARQTRAASAREVTLSRFSSLLLRPGPREDLFAAAARAADALIPNGRGNVVETVPDDTEELFVVPVEVAGEVVAAVVADARLTTLRGTQDALRSVARGLALALERDRLLAEQRAAAEGLAEQNAQLRELDRMKDQLVSSVSHELRTPLTSMGGYTELLLSGEVGELNDEQRSFAEVIDRNCRRLNRLIDDILFVSRVDAGRLSLERGWVDVAEVAAASLETARVRAERGGLTTELVVGDDVPAVWADATRLAQLFDNLVSNAVKFTPPGGNLRIAVAAGGEAVQIEVADTGIGIPASEVGQLFERFFRSSAVGAVAGTGLGLSIVKSIVEVHDGTITATSVEGVGTTFRIELPVRPLSAATAPASQEVAE